MKAFYPPGVVQNLLVKGNAVTVPKRGNEFMKALGMIIMLAGLGGLLSADSMDRQAPEIDPGSAGSAIALLSGALLVFKSRKK